MEEKLTFCEWIKKYPTHGVSTEQWWADKIANGDAKQIKIITKSGVEVRYELISK